MAPRKPSADSPPGDAKTAPATAASVSTVTDAELMARVDMRKPMIPQIYRLLHTPVEKGGLNKELYLRWVHTPFYYREEPKYMRFFESDSREVFSKVSVAVLAEMRTSRGRAPGAAAVPPPRFFPFRTPHCGSEMCQAAVFSVTAVFVACACVPFTRALLHPQVVWWVIPAFWLPIISFFLLQYAPAFPLLTAVKLFALGMFYWTFVEYTLHRFVFHLDAHTPDVPKALSMHFLLHGVHHKVPNDRYRLVFPPLPAVVLCILVGALSRALTRPFLPSIDEFAVFYCGMVFGYVLYDMAHYAFHHGTYPPSSLLGKMRKYHLKHHYSDQYNRGFGITSPFWDYLFGTQLSFD